jgi:hypothetical protein
VADLALGPQRVERRGDGRGVHEVVGAVELVEVDRLDAEAAEGAFAGPEDVVGGKIVAGGGVGGGVALEADAALGGDEDAVAQAGLVAENFAEEGLAPAGAVDVGVVEEGVT